MTAPIDTEKLDRCPFCGGIARVVEWMKYGQAHFTANCTRCDATATDSRDAPSATKAWNRRAHESRAQPASTVTDDLAQTLHVIRQHVARDPSALAASIMATCDAALAAHESRAQPASVPDPDWLANLRHELRMSKITHHFTLTRNELAYILGDPLLAPLPAQPASVADGYRQIGWVHPVYLDQHIDAGALAIEVSQPRLSDAQVPVFVRTAAPQPPAKENVS